MLWNLIICNQAEGMKLKKRTTVLREYYSFIIVIVIKYSLAKMRWNPKLIFP